MDLELLNVMVAERVARRHDDAAAERLGRQAHVVEDPLVRSGGPIWSIRRSVGFLLVRVGLRTALGGARC
jgi:hypothetical protein